MHKSPQQIGRTYSRVDLSHYHLYSAFMFAQYAERMEETASQLADSESIYQYRSFVISGVVSSVAFLESKLAELRSDAQTGGGLSAFGLATKECEALVAALDHRWQRAGILDRYQMVLEVLGKVRIEIDRRPFQDVALVVKLRNYLVHFPGEWLVEPDDETSTFRQEDVPLIERQLKGQFRSTKFAWPAQPFFPDHCLTAGCARWAAESTLLFAKEFSSRAGVIMKHVMPTVRGR